MLRSYQDLKVWQKAFALCVRVYEVTRVFPAEERFGLTSQMRKSAVSIPSNIAEGYARGTTRDYVRFLNIANGSVAELETQLMLARTLKFSNSQSLGSLLADLDEIERMLGSLVRSLARKVPNG